MATIGIVDTGYPNITSIGTVAASADRANSGSVITFKCTKMRYTRDANLDNTNVPSKYSDMEVNYGSIENPIIEISGVLDRTITADMDLVSEFDELVTTKGIKCLYYNSTSDGYRDLTDSLGATDAYTNHPASTPHLHGRIKSFTITQNPGSVHLPYTLMFQVTA